MLHYVNLAFILVYHIFILYLAFILVCHSVVGYGDA